MSYTPAISRLPKPDAGTLPRLLRNELHRLCASVTRSPEASIGYLPGASHTGCRFRADELYATSNEEAISAPVLLINVLGRSSSSPHLGGANHDRERLTLKPRIYASFYSNIAIRNSKDATLRSKLKSLNHQLLKQRLPHRLSPVSTDDETFRDTLEGITDLHEMIAAVIRSALVDEALHVGLRSRVDDMKERLSRFELRASKKRQLALEAMTEVGLSKLEQPDFTASARAGSPALVVIAEDRIPEAYWLPQPPKLDRQTILGELKRGIEIPGAQMSNPKPVLSVRTK